MSITLSSVTKSFGAHKALNQVSLEIADGEFFVVLGPSGCGKSTLLRAIAGLEPVDAGEIRLGGERVAGPGVHMPPEARNVGVVFQSYALWPHMSVAGNVAFPLETARLAKPEAAARTAECLATVELTPFAARRPADLSGGQRQRVALARCLAQSARTILMDEPLANLDPHLRSAMEEELASFHQATGATTLFITHDQREAMALAGRIAVMWDGEILQAADPDTLYREPVNARVAGFIGRSTIVPVEILAADGSHAQMAFAGSDVTVSCNPGTSPGPAQLVIRPENVVLRKGGMEATVERVVYRGGYWEVLLALKDLEKPLLAQTSSRPCVGDIMRIALAGGWVLPRTG